MTGFFPRCKQLLCVDMQYVTFCHNVICMYFSAKSEEYNFLISKLDSKSCVDTFDTTAEHRRETFVHFNSSFINNIQNPTKIY